jgi:hypothetical protein
MDSVQIWSCPHIVLQGPWIKNLPYRGACRWSDESIKWWCWRPSEDVRLFRFENDHDKQDDETYNAVVELRFKSLESQVPSAKERKCMDEHVRSAQTSMSRAVCSNAKSCWWRAELPRKRMMCMRDVNNPATTSLFEDDCDATAMITMFEAMNKATIPTMWLLLMLQYFLNQCL